MDIVSKLLDHGHFYIARDTFSNNLTLLDLSKCRQVCKLWRCFIDEEVIRTFPKSKQEKWHYFFGKVKMKTVLLDNLHSRDCIKKLYSVGNEIFVTFYDRVSIYDEGKYVGLVEVESCEDLEVTEKFYVFKFAMPTSLFQARVCHDVVVFAKGELGQRIQSRFPEEIERYHTYLKQSNSCVFFVTIDGRVLHLFKLNGEGTFKHIKMVEPDLAVISPVAKAPTLQLMELCHPHIFIEHLVRFDMRHVTLHNFENGSKVWAKHLYSHPSPHFNFFRMFLNDRLGGVFSMVSHEGLCVKIVVFDLATGKERTIIPNAGLMAPDIQLDGFDMTCVGDSFLVFVLDFSGHSTIIRALDLKDKSIKEPLKKLKEIRIDRWSVNVCQNGLILATASDFGRSALVDLYEPGIKPKVFKNSDIENTLEPRAWFGYAGANITCKGFGPASPVVYIANDHFYSYCLK